MMILLSKITFLLLLISFAFNTSYAQEERDTTDQISTGVDEIYAASPSVSGSRKAKGIEINYYQVSGFSITSKSEKEGVRDAEGEIDKLHGWEFKLKGPVVLKPRTKLIIGLSYKFEEYGFENPESVSFGLYRNLEEKHLKSTGLDLYLSRSIKRNKFILANLGVDLNGDFTKNDLPFSRFFKYTISGLYGWKVDQNTAYGMGLYFSHAFGGPRIYPAFMWNKTFNKKWGIEALLPANFMLRHNFSEKSILLGGFNIEGNSYHIVLDDPPLDQIKTLELRRSDLNLSLTYEQEIYDFLWFSVRAGQRFNLNFDLSEDNSFSDDVILDNKIDNTPFIILSIFIVPPKKLESKVLKAGDVSE